jgi:hypothetical protein
MIASDHQLRLRARPFKGKESEHIYSVEERKSGLPLLRGSRFLEISFRTLEPSLQRNLPQCGQSDQMSAIGPKQTSAPSRSQCAPFDAASIVAMI